MSVGPYQVRKKSTNSSAELEAEDERALLELERGDRVAEELAEVRLGAPEHRRLHSRRGRHVRANGAEGLADEPVGGPARQGDRPAGAADPGQLGRGPAVVGGEHRPVDREHGVEGGVRERKVFRVALDELDVEVFGRGAEAAALEQRRDVVDADGLAAPPCGRDRGVAAAGGDVEDAPPGLEVRGLAQVLGLEDDPRGDDGEVAARPGVCCRPFTAAKSGLVVSSMSVIDLL